VTLFAEMGHEQLFFISGNNPAIPSFQEWFPQDVGYFTAENIKLKLGE
jgi:hypothetical protein